MIDCVSVTSNIGLVWEKNQKFDFIIMMMVVMVMMVMMVMAMVMEIIIIFSGLIRSGDQNAQDQQANFE